MKKSYEAGVSSDVNDFPAGTPAASFSAYTELKANALERFNKKFNKKTKVNSDISMSVSMGLFSITKVDLTLLPLTVVGIEGGEAAWGILGMEGFNITQNGNQYTLTYKSIDAPTGEETTVIQTCVYNPAADSMQSTLSNESGTKTMFFEYTKAGNGYVSQYYFAQGGTYTTIKMVFNNTDLIAYGMVSNAASKPDSIIGANSLSADFVINEESYCILQGDVLTIFENGETKTY